MIDREKVLKGLECCIVLNGGLMERDCEDCPYVDDEGTCLSLIPLLEDARELLNADQTYLLQKDEEIARLNRELDAMNRLSEMQMATLEEQDEKIKKLHMLLNTKLSSEEQEPVKPTTAHSGGGSTWWNVCGACKTAINPNDKYCHECGVSIDWRVDDD